MTLRTKTWHVLNHLLAAPELTRVQNAILRGKYEKLHMV